MKEAEMTAKFTHIISDFIRASKVWDLSCSLSSLDVDKNAFLLNRLHGFSGMGAYR